MPQRSQNVMVYLYILETMDDIDKAQKALEGICYECNYVLPNHEGLCPLNPHLETVKRVMGLSVFATDLRQRALELISNLDADTMEEVLRCYKDTDTNNTDDQ